MRLVDIIAKKRDGHTLSREEIDFVVHGVTTGTCPDYQTSALLMAIVLRGMTDQETAWLTDAMVRSGDRIDLSDIPGVKVGKHSTGGVGDKVSIVLAPIVAACGVVFPKMSGRGLGHTGGTLDKLESIPGFRVDLSIDEFKRLLREVGTSIIGQTASLAPADRKLYALRDVTATVPAVPLICASVMSKKLAEGSDALVLDVKCGDGAFMKDPAGARALAASMVAIGAYAGVRTTALITDMESPLGHAVGNSLEMVECMETLKGHGPQDLTGVVSRVASRMLALGGIEADASAAAARVAKAISSGDALQKWITIIERQGGDARVVDDYRRLPSVRQREQCLAPSDGFVIGVGAEAIGRASSLLGAGRNRIEDAVDHAVGVIALVKPGERVQKGQPLVEVHHRDGRGLEPALALCREAVTIGPAAPEARPTVLAEVP